MPTGHESEPVPYRRKRRSRGAVLGVAVLAVLSLVAASCGGGRSSSPTTTNGGSATSTNFGDLESPCGSGNASGATAKGVTDTSIAIGYGDDAGYAAAPGLNKEIGDAMKAMIGWCNDQGGINGRKLVGTYYDAAILEANNRMTEACDTQFMLVGQGFAFDSIQEQTRLACGLASVPTYSVSPAFANGANMYQGVPNPVDKTPLSGAYQLAQLFPDAVKKTAVFTADYSATKDTTDKAKLAFPAAGWNFLDCEQTYAIGGESNWTPFVQRLKDCGAEVVYFAGSPAPNFENVLDAAKAIGYSPKWYLDANFYDQTFQKWNTLGNGDNSYIRMAFTPFEQASTQPATQQYLDLLAKSGGKTGLLGAQAVSSFLLWATAAQSCGSTLTSACVTGNLKNVHEWAAGGLHVSTDPGNNIPPDCGMLLQLKGTNFVQAAPPTAGEFDCSPKYVGTITGPVVDAAKLDANRISHAAG